MIRILLSFLMVQPALAANENSFKPDFHVGIKTFHFSDMARKRQLDTRVWYPVERSVAEQPLFGGPVFLPVQAVEDAKIAKEPKIFPLIVLSHGSGGLGVRLSWLAQFLVRKGYVVVTLDHPGNRAGDNSPDGLMKVWERPQDVSFVLTQILANADFRGRIDSKKIGAVGHSAGGTTVLLLAGGRLDKKQLANPIPGCAGTDPFFLQLCEGMKKLDLKKYPKKEVERSYHDERVRAVVALDPGFGPSFNPDSFKSSQSKILILAAGELHDPADELFVSALKKSLPPRSYEVVRNANHMTFLTACNPGAEKKIPDVADVCWKSVERSTLQKQVEERIMSFFQDSL